MVIIRSPKDECWFSVLIQGPCIANPPTPNGLSPGTDAPKSKTGSPKIRDRKL